MSEAATNFIGQIMREALYLIVTVSAPPVVLGMLVGVAIAIFQATTQIHEQTLTFAPKLVMFFLVLILLGSWLGSLIVRFTFEIFDTFPNFVH